MAHILLLRLAKAFRNENKMLVNQIGLDVHITVKRSNNKNKNNTKKERTKEKTITNDTKQF